MSCLIYPVRLIIFIVCISTPLTVCSWSVTAHLVIADIAKKHLSTSTLAKINRILNTNPDFPPDVRSDKNNIKPAHLAKRLDNLIMASIWADAIKDYYWQGQRGYRLKQTVDQFHYLNVSINPTESCHQLNVRQKIHQAMGQQPFNVIRAIQASMKSLIESKTSAAEKSIALRFLIHLIGDVHQPLHLADPVFKKASPSIDSTLNGNRIQFAKDDQPIIEAYYQKAFSPILIHEANLHGYWDKTGGLYRQLPPYTSAHFRAIWRQNKQALLVYIGKIANQLSTYHKLQTQSDLSIFKWAVQSTRMGCQLVNETRNHLDYHIKPDQKKVMLTFDQKAQNIATLGLQHYRLIERAISQAGFKLGKLLEAIFNPKEADPDYKEGLVRIQNNSAIPTLKSYIKRSKQH